MTKTWATVPLEVGELQKLLLPMKFSDAYGMPLGKAKEVLQWALRNGYPRATITTRPNGLHGVAVR